MPRPAVRAVDIFLPLLVTLLLMQGLYIATIAAVVTGQVKSTTGPVQLLQARPPSRTRRSNSTSRGRRPRSNHGDQ